MTIRARIFLTCLVGLTAASGSWAQIAANDCSTCTSNCASACLQSTSRLDSLMNPTRGSDERFFTSAGGPANIMVVLDTSGSMHDWVQDWPEASPGGPGPKGCTDPAYNFINNLGYDPTVTYTPMWSNLTTPNPNWFNKNYFYRGSSHNTEHGNNGTFGADFTGSPIAAGALGTTPTAAETDMGKGTGWADTTGACAAFPTAADRTLCANCLNTKGFYVQGDYGAQSDNDQWRDRRYSGNFLNLYSPRDVGAVSVLSQIAHDVKTVRFGMLAFDRTGPGNCWRTDTDEAWTVTGPREARICMVEEMAPTCALSNPLNAAAVNTSRDSIITKLQTQLVWSRKTPLASSVYAAGHYFRSKASDPFPGWFGGDNVTDNGFDENVGTDNKSICSSCAFNAMIVLTDGEANGESINFPDEIDAQPGASDVERVGHYWWTHDMRPELADMQRIATYTIGFSNDADTVSLVATAAASGGRYYSATNTVALKSAISSILGDIATRNTSFSSAAISSVQTSGSGALSALVPRFVPQRDQLWAGKLFRFAQRNEFVEDTNLNPTEVQADGGLDNDKNDTFITDTTSAIVVENTTGGFIRKVGGANATPYWEAGAALVDAGYPGRTVWTVVDSDNNGSLTSDDARIAFTTANSGTLAPYLGILGTPFCPTLLSPGTMLTKFGITITSAATLLGLGVPGTQAQLDTLCVNTLIEFVRGRDLADEDGDGDRNETRASVLGDIFHSSPIVVDPPVEKEFCAFALHNQCVATLFRASGSEGGTPWDSSSEVDCSGTTVTMDAYDAYVNTNRKRDRIALVGANDGMLHAFHDGTGSQTGCGTIAWTTGTGAEVWAMIPPDLLPRLQEMVFGHAYYVDGDISVRDVWADANNDGRKQKGEFHTVAIVAEGRGGTHYHALELLFDNAGRLTNPIGVGGDSPYRWMYPQPCSDEASLFGKTLFTIGPKPPPIGPVLLATSTLTPTPANPISRPIGPSGTAIDTTERWVAMLSGGWSPALEKGHGFFMVDAFNGTVNGRSDNLIWKMARDSTANGHRTEPMSNMDYSIVAPVALVDYGENGKAVPDGFFDTAVVGDTGGVVWLARFFQAGEVDTTTHLVTNWSGARVLEMDRDKSAGGNDDDGRPGKNKKTTQSWPFHYLLSAARQPGSNRLRVFGGTGNRYALLEQNAGTCRFDNMESCSKYDCDKTDALYTISKNTLNASEMRMRWKRQDFVSNTQTVATVAPPAPICGANGTTVVSASFSRREVQNCTPQSGAAVSSDFGQMRVDCGKDALGNFACRRTDAVTENLNDVAFTPQASVMTGLGKNRFFGIWAYGDSPAKMFNEAATSPSMGNQTARQFDALRVSDRTSSSGTSGQLVDVSTITCTTATSCTGTGALPGGNPQNTAPNTVGSDGWFYDYPSIDNRTATSSALLEGCVIWNSVLPDPSAVATSCAQPAVALGRLHQANFITGLPNCATGFKDSSGNFVRTLERGLVAPPPEPAVVVQRSPTRQIRYSVMGVEVNGAQATDSVVGTTKDSLQGVYALPVSRALHNCRHVPGAASNANCVEAP
jgi:type IV pilus assembly protein PilY1